MGLSDYEYTFYAAIADNRECQRIDGKKPCELAVVLYEQVKECLH